MITTPARKHDKHGLLWTRRPCHRHNTARIIVSYRLAKPLSFVALYLLLSMFIILSPVTLLPRRSSTQRRSSSPTHSLWPKFLLLCWLFTQRRLLSLSIYSSSLVTHSKSLTHLYHRPIVSLRVSLIQRLSPTHSHLPTCRCLPTRRCPSSHRYIIA